jgi:rhamnose transport system permease protein
VTARRLLVRLVEVRELGLLILLALLVIGTTAVNSRFIEVSSLQDILLNTSITALLAVGQTLVVLTRNIDLSVGSVLGLSAYCVGVLFADHHVSIPVALLAGLLVGAVCGLINGVLVAVCRIPALVVTLGTLYIFRGLDSALAGGDVITADKFPDALLDLGNRSILGVPILALITLVVLGVAAWGLRNLRSGRELYAIGSNPDAARLAGIRVGRRLFGAFILSGMLAGLAGVMYAARFGSVDAGAGTGLELDVVAAVVVGGVAIFGGSGSVAGAVLGALVLSTINSVLVILKVEGLYQQAISGGMLLGAIALDRLVALRSQRALRASASRGATVVPANVPPTGRPDDAVEGSVRQ